MADDAQALGFDVADAAVISTAKSVLKMSPAPIVSNWIAPPPALIMPR